MTGCKSHFRLSLSITYVRKPTNERPCHLYSRPVFFIFDLKPNTLNKPKTSPVILIAICLTVICFSCEEDKEPSQPSNISGTLTYKGGNFSMKGGLLDEKSDSTFYRTTFEFKVSDQPIHQTIRKVFEIYGDSREKINIEFKLTGNSSGDVIETGTYHYSAKKLTATDFPSGLILHHAYVYVGTGSTIYNHAVTDGEIVIAGTFPNYSLTFSLVTNEGNVAGTVSGEFITRSSYNDFFNAK